MNLVVGSCFRQAAGAHTDKYAARIAALQALATVRGDVLHVISVWGDSTDATPEALGAALGKMRLASLQLFRRDHGFPDYGSSTHPDRIAGFAYAANGVFEAVGAGADVVVYVESDLIWTAETIYAGIDQLTPTHEILALPTFCLGTETFYDIWAFRDLAGVPYAPVAPYASSLRPTGLTEVSSAGGCLVMTGALARRYRCSPGAALVGFCHRARTEGHRVWTDWAQKVWHP